MTGQASPVDGGLIRRAARMLGFVRVVLHDHDGEVNRRWAREVGPDCYTCYRYTWPSWRPCALMPDGSVRGPSYVESWTYAPPHPNRRATQPGETEA